MTADCRMTPQEECRTGIYGVIRTKISWARFCWIFGGTIGAILLIGGTLLNLVNANANASAAQIAEVKREQAVMAKDAEYTRAMLTRLEAGNDQILKILMERDRERQK